MNTQREKLRPTSVTNLIMDLAEGNPGAITAMMQLMEACGGDPMEAFMPLLGLDDMNMRGSQIWAGFKYHCKGDAKAFLQCIKDRDPAMIETVNKEVPGSEVAVTSGASYAHY